jgi:hypothetical protein
MNVHRACRQLHHLALAGEVVGALALDLERREARRHLLDGSAEARQQRGDRLGRRPRRTRFDNAALGIVGVALLAPSHRELIGLAAVHDERDRLGGFPERDRQAAGGERIERAGMPGALGRKQPLDHADGVRRGHADRLVEHQPAVHVPLRAFDCLCLLIHVRTVPVAFKDHGHAT